ncbi:hypothetical protein VE03_10125 [Pseudogymnoascus sp. 23342-1-I1]|nr:hypothetical protein VE03_10125 [Pseudogymnoascus sp. 23342-1-I1]
MEYLSPKATQDLIGFLLSDGASPVKEKSPSHVTHMFSSTSTQVGTNNDRAKHDTQTNPATGPRATFPKDQLAQSKAIERRE